MPELILDANSIRRLLAASDGDAALLYLCRAAGLSEVATGFDEPRLEHAARLLRQLGLDPGDAPRFLQASEPPAYTEQDVQRQLERESFQKLMRDVQRRLGKVLNTEELKILISMSEYLGLSHEVIPILVNYCVDRSRSRGSGRLPSLRTIEKEAYRWADEGVDTMERAAAFIKTQNALRDRRAWLLGLLGLEGRKLTPTEEKYLGDWAQLPLSDEAFALALDKTCTNTGSFKWSYMNSILKSWQAQGLSTVEEINARDRVGAKPPKKFSGFQHSGQEFSQMMKDDAARLLRQQGEG